MADTESSISGSGVSLELEESELVEQIVGETITIPQVPQPNQDDEKLEEFSKLLKSMMESRSPTEEGEEEGQEEPEEEDIENVMKGIQILPSLLMIVIYDFQSAFYTKLRTQ